MKKLALIIAAAATAVTMTAGSASAIDRGNHHAPHQHHNHRAATWTADSLSPSCVNGTTVQTVVKVVRPSSTGTATFIVNFMDVTTQELSHNVVKFGGNTGYFAIQSPNDTLFSVEKVDGTVLYQGATAGALAVC